MTQSASDINGFKIAYLNFHTETPQLMQLSKVNSPARRVNMADIYLFRVYNKNTQKKKDVKRFNRF